MLHLILLVFAFVLFTLAAISPTHPQAPRLCYAGLAVWVLSILLTGVITPVR
jgi:hypothetical protein